MKIFLNKEIKLLFMVLGVFSLILIALGILAARMAADDYKQKMIAHDYQIAGYLTQNGVEKSLVIRAFTAEKSNEDAETGQKLLQKTGSAYRSKRSPSGYRSFLPKACCHSADHFDYVFHNNWRGCFAFCFAPL